MKGDLSFMKSYVVTQSTLESHSLILIYGKWCFIFIEENSVTVISRQKVVHTKPALGAVYNDSGYNVEKFSHNEQLLSHHFTFKKWDPELKKFVQAYRTKQKT